MTNNHFLTSARSLAAAAEKAGHPLSAYALLNITEALVLAGVNFAESVPAKVFAYHTHEGRVQAALDTPEVIDHMRAGKRINAIKALRQRSIDDTGTAIGLRDAKEACEDYRVMAYYHSNY